MINNSVFNKFGRFAKRQKLIPAIALIAVYCLLSSVTVYAGTAIKTVEYYVDQATGQIDASANHDDSLSIYIPESNFSLVNAWVEVYWEGDTLSTTGYIEIDGTNTENYNPIDQTGENFHCLVRYNAYNALSGMSGNGTTNGTYTIRTNFNRTRDNESIKLYLTYKYDDTSETQLKTVRFFAGTRNTSLAINNTQTFSHTPYIPESSYAIQSLWYEWHGHPADPDVALTDASAIFSLNSGSDQNPKLREGDDNSTGEWLYLYNPSSYPTIGSSNNVSIMASGVAEYCISAELVITYIYNDSLSNTFITTVRRFLGEADNPGVAVQNHNIPLYFPEAPYSPQIRSVYGILRTASEDGFDITMSQNFGQDTLTFDIAPGSSMVSQSTILYDFSSQYSNAKDRDILNCRANFTAAQNGWSIEMVYTYEYPKQATRRQKTVYYTAGSGESMQDLSTATGTKTYTANVDMPEAERDTIVNVCVNASGFYLDGTADQPCRFNINVNSGLTDYITLDLDYAEGCFYQRIKNITGEITGSGANTINVNLRDAANAERSHISNAVVYATYQVVTADETRSFIKVAQTRIPATGTQADVTVFVKDNYSRAIANKSVTLYTTRGTGQTTINGSPATTDANGMCTFVISSTEGGQDEIYATADGKTIRRGVYNGLVLSIPMEENGGDTTYDQSGYNNNGAISGSPAWDTGYWSSKDINFDGINDYVDCGIANLNISNSVTVMAWVNLNATEAWDRIVIRSPWPNNDFGLLLGDNYNAGFAVWIGGIEYNAYSDSYVQPGQWCHLAGTYNGTYVKMYINAALAKANAASGNVDNNGGNLNIARDPNTGSPVNARVDEVKIYNRVLYPEEIYAEYTGKCTVLFYDISVDETRSALLANPATVSITGPESSTVTTTIRNSWSIPLSGRNVTLTTARGPGQTNISSPNLKTTNAGGQCSWTVSSANIGYDTITAVCEGNSITNLFFDSFEFLGSFSNWTCHQGLWSVENGYIKGLNSGDDGYLAYGISAGDVNWRDYFLSVRMRPVASSGENWRDSFRIGFRYIDANNGYTLEFLRPGNNMYLHKKANGISTGYGADSNPLASSNPIFNISFGTWYNVLIRVLTNRITVWVDGTQYIDCYDTNVLGVSFIPNGKIMLSAHDYNGGGWTT